MHEQNAVPAPPRLGWGWVLLLAIVTGGLFGSIWLIVQSNWVKKVNPESKSMTLLIVAFVLQVLNLIVGRTLQPAHGGIISLIVLAIFLVAVFRLRSELQSAPIGLKLGPVMTFFFNALYFQYHLSRYNTPAELPVAEVTPGA